MKIGTVVLLSVTALVCAALYELGKNTVWGWMLAAAAIAGFVLLRIMRQYR